MGEKEIKGEEGEERMEEEGEEGQEERRGKERKREEEGGPSYVHEQIKAGIILNS